MFHLFKEQKLKTNKMNMTNHFRERLNERTGYNVETFLYDLNNRRDEIIKMDKYSEELDWYPYLKDSYKSYPNSILFLIESLKVCLVSDGRNLITLYNIG